MISETHQTENSPSKKIPRIRRAKVIFVSIFHICLGFFILLYFFGRSRQPALDSFSFISNQSPQQKLSIQYRLPSHFLVQKVSEPSQSDFNGGLVFGDECGTIDVYFSSQDHFFNPKDFAKVHLAMLSKNIAPAELKAEQDFSTKRLLFKKNRGGYGYNFQIIKPNNSIAECRSETYLFQEQGYEFRISAFWKINCYNSRSDAETILSRLGVKKEL